MDIRLVIFDFDGTLGDTRRNIVKTLQDTMVHEGMEVRGEAECAATIGIPLVDSFIKMFPELTREQAEHCAEVYLEIFEENKKTLIPEAFPHVCETLEKLAHKGIVLTVASSRRSASLHVLMKEMGIDRFVSYVLGADNVTKAKPDPEPVLKTLRELKVNADVTLVVGDMPVDMMMGAGAGAHTCAVTYGNASREQLEAAGAEYVIDDIAELPGLLER